MSLAEWDASALPPKARYSAFGEALSESHLGWDVYGGTSDFSAVIRRRNLDQIDFVSCSCDPCEGTRTKALIDQAGAASVGILFELPGREIVRQGERETQLSPGEFVVWDGAKPMEFRVTEPLEKLSLFVPKSVLRRHGIDIGQATSGPLGRNSRLAPIVSSHLRQIAVNLAGLSDTDLELVGHMALELIAATFRCDPAARFASPGDRALSEQITRYILDHLRDPALCPRTIAAANGCSVRKLHKLFSAKGLSVSRWILHQRLESCRQDLLHGDADRSITDTAFAWGFNDAAHFSRSFRTAYGQTPREIRSHSRRV